MQHVGADDEIERASLEALLHARFLEIENFVFHLGKTGQLLHGAGEKCRRDIAEGVGMQPAFEQRQHMRGQSACAGADLQDAQSAPFRQVARGFLHGRGDRRQPVAGVETLAIELVQQLRSGPGEQHLHGILFTAQDRPEFGADSRRRAGLRTDVRDESEMKERNYS